MRMNIQSSEMSQTMAPVQQTSSNQQTKQMTTTEKVHTIEKSSIADTKINHTELNKQKTKDNEAKDNEAKDNVKEKQLLAEIEKASGKIEVENKGLEFSIHEGTNRIMIRVINEKTKEVVREIPPEKVLDAIAKIIDLSGLFVDEKR